jgi:hypothetical protein
MKGLVALFGGGGGHGTGGPATPAPQPPRPPRGSASNDLASASDQRLVLVTLMPDEAAGEVGGRLGLLWLERQ